VPGDDCDEKNHPNGTRHHRCDDSPDEYTNTNAYLHAHLPSQWARSTTTVPDFSETTGGNVQRAMWTSVAHQPVSSDAFVAKEPETGGTPVNVRAPEKCSVPTGWTAAKNFVSHFLSPFLFSVPIAQLDRFSATSIA